MADPVSSKKPIVLAVISDLLFRSKIDAAARSADVPLRVARNLEQLTRHLQSAVPAVMLIDLEMTGVETNSMLDRLRETPGGETVPVIGFAGHTNVDVIRSARASGVQVMARSAFVDQLPLLMQRIATHGGQPR